MVQPPGLYASWLFQVGDRLKLFQEALSKEQKETSQELSKACLANHQSGPDQMPPPGPFGSKGYWITLRSVRLAPDLEVGPTPKAGGVVDA